MLATIHPTLTGTLLAALDRLGHGEELVVSDANYPAYSTGVEVIELAGVGTPHAVAAIRTVLPLDGDLGPAALTMHGEGEPRLPVHDELGEAASAATPDRLGSLERFAFYERAAGARLIVRTGETRPWANLILRKGVVKAATTFTPA